MIRIVLTCLVTGSLLFVGCDEPKPAVDPGAATAAPTGPPTPPKKGARSAAPEAPKAGTKPVD